MSDTRDAGYDDFLDAAADGDPYYLESESGAASLPPLPRDPATGKPDLTEKPLPEPGQVLTYTRTAVAAPEFADDAPYIVAVAEFGPVRLTGQLRGVDPDDLAIGQSVELDVGRSETRDERVIVFSPA
jgi:uncharacterized OB-fold protein